jgi:hypothetical protein
MNQSAAILKEKNQKNTKQCSKRIDKNLQS